jgi:3-hydroxyisobutyrate dehydrogenase-like beta-hydroxyacid dehydrogenase
MGAAMARNLQRHLAAQKAPNMLYCNRTMSRGDALKPLGGVPEPSFERVVDECGIIFTMVDTTHLPDGLHLQTPPYANSPADRDGWTERDRYPTTQSITI